MLLNRRRMGANVAVMAPQQYPEAAAVFRVMSPQPDEARQVLYINLIEALKAAGVWAKLDVLYVFRAHATQPSRVNLVIPSQTVAALISTPTFAADLGWTGAATSGLSSPTLWNAFTQLTLNSQTIGVWIGAGTDAAATEFSVGQLSGSAVNALRPRNASGNFTAMMASGTESSFGASATILGHFTAVRTASNALKGYKDGVATGTTATTVSAALSSSQPAWLYHNGNGNDFRIEFGYIGSQFSDADATAMHDALAAYRAAT